MPFLGVPVGLVVALVAGGYQPAAVEQIYPKGTILTASPRQRLGAYLLDFAFAYFTLGVGWLIWFAIVAPRGQTPAKQLLNLYVLHDDGARAGGGYIWLREVLIKGLLFGFISIATLYVAWFFAALWCVWDRDRQCLWDKVGSTLVAYSPLGVRPHTRTEASMPGGTLLPTEYSAPLRTAPATDSATQPARGLFCTACGTRSNTTDEFCSNCGTHLAN